MTQTPFHHPPIRDGWTRTDSKGAWTLTGEAGQPLGMVYREDAQDFRAQVPADSGLVVKPTHYDTLEGAMIAVESVVGWRGRRVAELEALAVAEREGELSEGLAEAVRKKRGRDGFLSVYQRKTGETE